MTVFLTIFIVTLSVLLILAIVAWYLSTNSPSYYASSWMSQMWGSHLGGTGNSGGMAGMMGNGTGTTTASYFWLIPVALIAITAVATIGVGFYIAFPELRFIKGSSCSPQTVEPASASTKTAEAAASVSSTVLPSSNASTVSNSCEVLLKTMTPDEQKVLNVLISHQGKYLQKYVVKEAGLSRLKTHRIVARFAERAIVTVKEFGNTNEIQLSDWVKSSVSSKT